jgi:hypothetical protein
MLHEADRVVEQYFVVGHMDTDRREPGQIGVEGRRKRIGRILTVQIGVPLPAVSARLGHSSVRTTQEIYAHMITGQDEEAARKWEEYQQRNRPAVSESWKGDVQ